MIPDRSYSTQNFSRGSCFFFIVIVHYRNPIFLIWNFALHVCSLCSHSFFDFIIKIKCYYFVFLFQEKTDASIVHLRHLHCRRRRRRHHILIYESIVRREGRGRSQEKSSCSSCEFHLGVILFQNLFCLLWEYVLKIVYWCWVSFGKRCFEKENCTSWYVWC